MTKEQNITRSQIDRSTYMKDFRPNQIRFTKFFWERLKLIEDLRTLERIERALDEKSEEQG